MISARKSNQVRKARTRSRRRPAQIGIKRVYDERAPDDGARILIDRLWPRGVAKAALALDAWRPDIAPSHELRRWYGHEPGRYAEFKRRYTQELAPHRADISELAKTFRGRPLTLLTSTRELELSHATVLREMILKAMRGAAPAKKRTAAKRSG
jgi:uncharacterized protein YeaO (DUF488 family)